jgi:hypothetical protein
MPIHLTAGKPVFALAILFTLTTASVFPDPQPPSAAPLPAGRALPFRTAIFESSMRFAGSPTGPRVRVWYSPLGSLEERVNSEGTSYVLRGDRYSYVWAKGRQTGVKTVLSGSSRAAGLPDALDVIRETGFDLLPSNSKFVGVDEIDGRRVKHYDFRWRDHFQKAIREGSIWVLEDRLFPVKFVNTGAGGKFEIVNSNFRFDVEIPKELFEPPKDIRFSEFEAGFSGRGGGGRSPNFPAAPRPLQVTPLPDAAYAVEWISADVPARIEPLEKKIISVSFRNVSTIAWPNPSTTDPDHSSGAYAVRLCSRWTKAGEPPKIESYKTRTDLRQPLQPGQTVTLAVTVTAPSEPGRYELQFDLVQELVSFFERKGVERLVRTVEVR